MRVSIYHINNGNDPLATYEGIPPDVGDDFTITEMDGTTIKTTYRHYIVVKRIFGVSMVFDGSERVHAPLSWVEVVVVDREEK